MFAPHCPTCDRRVLLGPRRIVRFASTELGHDVVLQCHCGELVAWDQVAPAAAPVEPEPVPVPATT